MVDLKMATASVLFKKFPDSMERELKEIIVLNHLRAAQTYLSQFGSLAKRDAQLPYDWSLEKKLQYIFHLCS